MITPRCGVFFSQGNEDRALPGLLYGMPLSGTACALRDFAHAQNHPSDGRPHAGAYQTYYSGCSIIKLLAVTIGLQN
ncbi:hypothetical protein BZ856_23410 [Salmonella enterica subsp. enterica serovar Enteritidis]|nr:hypothetical protein [Salmonella enterica subsp. enterica serovar Enteritidis]